MGCFCHQSIATLQQTLRRLDQTQGQTGGQTPGQAASTATPRQAQQTRAVAEAASWLAARGLPAPPWRPEPAWLTQTLPTPALGPNEMATISALATLRSDAQEGLGIDPLQPEQARPLARVAATLNTRLATLARTTPPPDPGPWQRLAAQSEAADAVQQAADNGLLDPSPEQVESYTQPAGRPMRQWLGLLRQVRTLSPLIAAASQLGQSLDDDPEGLTQRLAETLRSLRSLPLPPPADPVLTSRLIATLSAVGRLRRSLGVDPTTADYEQVQQAVAAKTAAAAELLQQSPPKDLPYCPTTIAPAAVLRAAMSPGVRTLAAVGWKVPPADTVPALQNGLPVSALAKQMAALGMTPVRQAPCGSGCDAARIMQARG